MQNEQRHAGKKSPGVRATAVLLSFLTTGLFIAPPSISYAGKEGVFINSSVYFTLEDVSVSQGAKAGAMQFSVQLNNGGTEVIDYNRYGVRVTTAGGASYYAQLTQKAEAQVAPGSSALYTYAAKIPAGLSADGLKVTIVERSGSSSREIGSLSAASAVSYQEQPNQVLLNLAEVDTSLSAASFVSVQAVRGFAVPDSGRWKVALDLALFSQESEEITLPSALKYSLIDAGGTAVPMTAQMIDSSTSTGLEQHVLLTAELDAAPELGSLRLGLSRSGSAADLLGSLALDGLFDVAAAGVPVPYPLQGQAGVTLEIQKAQSVEVDGDRHALITAVLHNGGKRTLQVPTLTGQLVSRENALAIDAEAVSSPDKYLAAGKSAVYRFAAELPSGTDTGTLQFLLSEEQNVTTTTSSSASASSGSTSTAAASGSAAGSTTGTGTGTASSSTAASSATTKTSTSSAAVPVLAVSLPSELEASTTVGSIPAYELGQPMSFDSASSLIDPKLEVSVVELNGHTNAENGYQTVVAKFKFLNKSSSTLTLPAFDTQLRDAAGTTYSGTRQTTELQELIPGSAYVYSYSYLLPPASKGDYTLSILDATSSSKFKLGIADYAVEVQQTGTEEPFALEKTLSLYPFNVKINAWTLASLYSSSSYTYKLKVDLDIEQVEQVMVDDTFSTLEFELVDNNGRVLGSMNQTLQGTNKLISGLQTLTFSDIKSEQFNYPLTIKVYEIIPSPTGSAKRLLATMKQ